MHLSTINPNRGHGIHRPDTTQSFSTACQSCIDIGPVAQHPFSLSSVADDTHFCVLVSGKIGGLGPRVFFMFHFTCSPSSNNIFISLSDWQHSEPYTQTMDFMGCNTRFNFRTVEIFFSFLATIPQSYLPICS